MVTFFWEVDFQTLGMADDLLALRRLPCHLVVGVCCVLSSYKYIIKQFTA